MRNEDQTACVACDSCRERIVDEIDKIIRRHVASRALTVGVVNAFLRFAVDLDARIEKQFDGIEKRLDLIVTRLNETSNNDPRP